MNLYKIFTPAKVDYDRFDSMVVAAKSVEQCRELSDKHAFPADVDWSERKDLEIVLIGRAVRGTQPGVIVSSYNAG